MHSFKTHATAILGLCVEAVKNEVKNRYCNLFPFDRNLVTLENGSYINASWIELPKGIISVQFCFYAPLKRTAKALVL